MEEQKKGMPPVTTGDLTGKTVMITGANSGIGFEAAKHFATMNPTRLIVVCRSVEKAQDSIASEYPAGFDIGSCFSNG